MSSLHDRRASDETRTDETRTLGRLRYLASRDQHPVIIQPPPGSGGVRRRTARYADHVLPVSDLRPLAGELSLDKDAVVLRQQPTGLADLYDDAAVSEAYYAETEAQIKAETGASRVLVFDHTRRLELPRGGGALPEREAVRSVHNDYTEISGPQRVRDLLGEEAERLLSGRFAIINTWRPITGPVQRAPLGFLHPASLQPGDLVTTELRYEDRSGEIYEIAHSPEHRWLYVPQMQRDELLIFKCFDSAQDGRARFLPHSAFDDLATPDGAPARESIETRSLVFFG
ncbi:MAG: CmcJ/NvfI family oxidoreductase [Pseudomonadota bacterium]